MGIIRNAANRKIRGRIGDTTYYVSMERQIARQALNSSNYGESARRTEAQQSRRVKWSNLVNFYKLSKGWMPKAFESKKKGQSDYNRFMSVNLGNSSVALTRDEALQGACVVEPFVISQGSLPSIEVTKVDNFYVTNLLLNIDIAEDETTVSMFTRSLLDSNPWIEEGMQLSFVSYQQFTNQSGVPQSTCAFYEVTLDLNNQNLLVNYLPYFCCNNENGEHVGAINISTGCFAYILSDQRNGKIRVSSQTLINNNAAMIALYSNATQRQRSIDSYGVDSEVVLSPITLTEQGALPQPFSINAVELENLDKTIMPNEVFGEYGQTLRMSELSIEVSNLNGRNVSALYALVFESSTRRNAVITGVTIEEDKIRVPKAAWPNGTWASKNVVLIGVELSDGTKASIQFDPNVEVHE